MDMNNLKNGVIAVVMIWAIVFGVNIDGKHYGLHFSTDGISLVWAR